MPKLLISVRSVEEAEAALRGGADIIDVKEPGRGSLGMANVRVIADIAAAVGGRVPVSAALGELVDWDDTPRIEGCDLQFVKVGLKKAPTNWRARLGDFFAALRPVRAIAVAYADAARCGAPRVTDVAEWAVTHEVAGFLIDTCVKDGRGLFDFLGDDELTRLVGDMRRAGRMIALAGSLQGASLQRAAALEPDIVAVRGAACVSGKRDAAVDEQAVARLREMLRPASFTSA